MKFVMLSDITSGLTKCPETCAVSYLVSGHLEGQHKDGSILK
jgi:hypothetical protein